MAGGRSGTEGAAPVRSSLRVLSVGIALLVVTLAVYWQVGGHAFLNYDDDTYIVRNPHVRSGLTSANIAWAFSSVEQCNWHPLTWLSHMLDVQIYGLNPRGHHLTNVAIHCSSSLLLLLLLLRLTGELWRSAFVAALFALHPLHVESVAWAAERKDVLSAFFCFLTLVAYSNYCAARPGQLSRIGFYLIALCCFMLGLMSKPMLVTFPLLMLLLDYWPLRRCEGPLRRNARVALVVEKIPFLICSALSSVITVVAQRTGGAMVALDWIPLGRRLQNSMLAIMGYIGKIFWPSGLGVLYPFPQSISVWHALAAAALLLAVTICVLMLGRRYRYLPVGWFWFLLTLLPVIGLVQVGNQSMADRYSYIPYVGLSIVLAWGVPDLCRVDRSGASWRRRVLALCTCGAIAAMVAVTWRQIGYWKDSTTLYRHTLQVTSGNFIILYNLGLAYGQAGNRTAAIEAFRGAARIRPYDVRIRTTLASALAENGDIDAALNEFSQAVALQPMDPAARYGLEYWRRQRDLASGAVK